MAWGRNTTGILDTPGWNQGPPGADKHIKRKRAPAKHYQPTVAGQYLQIVGHITNGTTSRQHAISVLGGEDAPTVTGGFANIGVIGRPQRVGMTILQGYDPVVLSVSLRFDAVVLSPGQSSAQLEKDIQVLEWMGGRGKLYASDGKAFAPGQGDPPLVNIFSADGNGNQTALIPPNCQDLDYWITGISYDTKPLRDILGNRIRQDCLLTLTQHVATPGTSFDSAATLAKQRNTDQGQFVYFTVKNKARNTIAKIMALYYHDQKHADWVTVLNDNKSDRRIGSSVHHVLPVGLKLKVRKKFVHHL